jgi:hypothetical protein
MADHVQIARREIDRLGRVQIPRDRQGFKENLRHDDGAAEVENDAAVMQLRERRGKASEVAVTRVADCSTIRRRMLVDDFGAQCCVDGAGNPEPLSRDQEGHLGMNERSFEKRSSNCFSHSPAILHSNNECFVHPATCFFRHSKSAIDEPARDIFGRCPKARDLIIVDCTRPIHREVSDDSPLHEVDQKRCNSSLHDVAAEHHDNRALLPGRRRNGGDDRAKVSRHEYVGKARQKCTEGAITSWRPGELFGPHLVRTKLDRDGTNAGQVGFGNHQL